MDLGLSGRRVVIAGASAGIGRATALALAQEGCRLALGARSQPALDEVATVAKDAGAEVVTAQGDLVEAAGARNLVEAAVERFGGVDALVCCVGSTPLGTFDEIDDAVWDLAWRGKFMASVRTLRAALPQLARADKGRAVVVAGNSAFDPSPMMSTSAVVNAALGALVTALAREYAGRGVGVVCVDPGPTETARFEGLARAVSRAQQVTLEVAAEQLRASAPTGGVCSPEEIATTIAFCLSPHVPQLTGTRVLVDGATTSVR
ncbi:MAG: SDR family oxidoreductase [Nocardioidaceae bacterium]